MAQYAQVVEIAAPDKAAPGSHVDVTFRVKNLSSDTISISVGGTLEYGSGSWMLITFPEWWANVGPGETYSFSGSFDMPDQGGTIHAYGNWYGSDGLWHFDNELTGAIGLLDLAPQVGELQIADYSAA